MEKAGRVVLLSGGVDSAVCLALAKATGGAVFPLFVDYGQLAAPWEQKAAIAMCLRIGCPLPSIITLRASFLNCGAAIQGMPIGYVPGRNLILLALAVGLAERRRASRIIIGTNVVDTTGVTDTNESFLRAAMATANLCRPPSLEGVTIEYPLQHLSKKEIFALARNLDVPIGETISCYAPENDGAACGKCGGCTLRMKGEGE